MFPCIVEVDRVEKSANNIRKQYIERSYELVTGQSAAKNDSTHFTNIMCHPHVMKF